MHSTKSQDSIKAGGAALLHPAESLHRDIFLCHALRTWHCILMHFILMPCILRHCNARLTALWSKALKYGCMELNIHNNAMQFVILCWTFVNRARNTPVGPVEGEPKWRQTVKGWSKTCTVVASMLSFSLSSTAGHPPEGRAGSNQ